MLVSPVGNRTDNATRNAQLISIVADQIAMMLGKPYRIWSLNHLLDGKRLNAHSFDGGNHNSRLKQFAIVNASRAHHTFLHTVHEATSLGRSSVDLAGRCNRVARPGGSRR